MSNRLSQPGQRALVVLYKEDIELAKKLYPRPVGYTRVVREAFHSFMNGQRKRIAALATQGETWDDDDRKPTGE